VGTATLLYLIGRYVDFKPIIGDEPGKIATAAFKIGAPLAGKFGVKEAFYAVGHFNVSSKYNDAIQKIKIKKQEILIRANERVHNKPRLMG